MHREKHRLGQIGGGDHGSNDHLAGGVGETLQSGTTNCINLEEGHTHTQRLRPPAINDFVERSRTQPDLLLAK